MRFVKYLAQFYLTSHHSKSKCSLFDILATQPFTFVLNVISESPKERDPQDLNISALKKKKKKKDKDAVHYITLKPFSKKERKRQKRAELAALEAGENPEEEEDEEEEEFKPRSPVPLPDASSCKPILVHLGFTPGKQKKGNNY